jgi:LEA14-like dessication related protein
MDDTDVGDTSPTTLSLTNTGGRSISVTMSVRGKDATEFSVSPATVSIAAGRTRSCTVTFSPIAAGVKTASIEISHDAGGNSLAVLLQGTGIAVVVEVPLTLSVAQLAMDDTPVGGSSRKTFAVTNNSTQTLSISLKTSGAAASEFAVTPASTTVVAKGSRTITVNFSPNTAGTRTAVIEISQSAGGNTLILPLQGNGLGLAAAAPLEASVTHLAMNDTPIRASSRKTFTITNNSTQALSISLNMNGTAANEFRASPSSATIAAKGSRTISVTFAPTRTGNRTAQLSIRYGTGGDAITVSLKGKGLSSSSVVVANEGSELGAAKPLDSSHSPKLSVGNYPNPFNSQTVFSYHLNSYARVRVEIFDLLGRRVCVLIDDLQNMGDHQITWDGTDQQGKSLGSGIYLYKLQTNMYSASGKMLLLR